MSQGPSEEEKEALFRKLKMTREDFEKNVPALVSGMSDENFEVFRSVIYCEENFVGAALLNDSETAILRSLIDTTKKRNATAGNGNKPEPESKTTEKELEEETNTSGKVETNMKTADGDADVVIVLNEDVKELSKEKARANRQAKKPRQKKNKKIETKAAEPAAEPAAVVSMKPEVPPSDLPPGFKDIIEELQRVDNGLLTTNPQMEEVTTSKKKTCRPKKKVDSVNPITSGTPGTSSGQVSSSASDRRVFENRQKKKLIKRIRRKVLKKKWKEARARRRENGDTKPLIPEGSESSRSYEPNERCTIQ